MSEPRIHSRLKKFIMQDHASNEFEVPSMINNSQYKNLTLRYSNKFHDRFLIIDKDTYHLGASLKDFGKKVFAFTKMNQELVF